MSLAETRDGEAKSAAMRWTAIVALVATWLVNEALPAVFGTGGKATWDWAFTYVTLRAILLPSFAVIYIVQGIFTMLWRRRLDILELIRCGFAATVIFFCWIYQGALFID